MTPGKSSTLGQRLTRAFRARSHSVSAHLAAFAISLLAPFLLIDAYILMNNASRQRAAELAETQDVARRITVAVDREIEKGLAIAQTLAASRLLRQGDYQAYDGQARDVAAAIKLNIVTRDRAGRQVSNTSVPFTREGAVSHDAIRALDRQSADTKGPVISDLVYGTRQGQPLALIIVPVMISDEARYFISISLTPDRLAHVMAPHLPQDRVVGLVGRDGRVIARSQDQERFVGTSSNRAFLDTAVKIEGTWTGATLDGMPIVGAYVRSPVSQWRVAVAVPETILRAPARWALWWLLALLGMAIVISALLGWIFSRQISAPMRLLVRQAHHLADRRALPTETTGVSEVNDVMDAMRDASRELERRTVEAVQSQEHLSFLMREISHRSKNLLAVVQGIARQSIKSASSLQDFAVSFGQRLQSMASAHDLLVQRDWHSVALRDLVVRQLSSFVGADDRRLEITGPTVELTPKTAESLGLALHELATNAVKYGGLKDDGGRVRITWSFDPASADPAAAFRMSWIERASGPIAPPTRKGFGRVVIERLVAAGLDGKVTLAYPPEGLTWRIEAPASCLVYGNVAEQEKEGRSAVSVA